MSAEHGGRAEGRRAAAATQRPRVRRPDARLAARLLAAIGLLAVPTGAAAPAAAQSLAERVRGAPDGLARMEFEAREGVCGNGRNIQRVSREGTCRCACEEGPVRVEMRVRRGEVTGLELRVGGVRDEPEGQVTDLGAVRPAEAADFLLDLAERGPETPGKRAVFAATLARGVEAWPRLLEIARGSSVPRETRRAAVFWVGQEAGERATEGLESVIRDADELEVREHAVFALSRQKNERAVEALIRIARANPEPRLRKRALFWLGQRADDPRVLALFEEILAGRP